MYFLVYDVDVLMDPFIIIRKSKNSKRTSALVLRKKEKSQYYSIHRFNDLKEVLSSLKECITEPNNCYWIRYHNIISFVNNSDSRYYFKILAAAKTIPRLYTKILTKETKINKYIQAIQTINKI